MDEPLSNLDAKLRVTMRAELKHLHHELGVTTVYVTHDQMEAMTLASRVAVMREGRIVQLDTPRKIYAEPADLKASTCRLTFPTAIALSLAYAPKNWI